MNFEELLQHGEVYTENLSPDEIQLLIQKAEHSGHAVQVQDEKIRIQKKVWWYVE